MTSEVVKDGVLWAWACMRRDVFAALFVSQGETVDNAMKTAGALDAAIGDVEEQEALRQTRALVGEEPKTSPEISRVISDELTDDDVEKLLLDAAPGGLGLSPRECEVVLRELVKARLRVKVLENPPPP